MTLRTVLVIVLALICGASAVVVVYQLRQDPQFPRRHCPRSDRESQHLTGQRPRRRSRSSQQFYPKHNKPEGALSSVDELAGRSVLAPLSKGLPIVESQLTSKHGGGGLAAMIPDGMRAFTIQTTHVAAGVGGFVQPGDKVDVLLTTTQAGQDDWTGGGVTTTLLQNVQVLAVAQRMEPPDDSKGGKDGKAAKVDPNDAKSVTLLVSPDQAAKLDLGMNKGILHLALRNPQDGREANTLPATMAQLRFHQEKPFNLADMLAQVIGDAGRMANGTTPTCARETGNRRDAAVVRRNPYAARLNRRHHTRGPPTLAAKAGDSPLDCKRERRDLRPCEHSLSVTTKS